MTSTPFSIILPTYNRASLISRAIHSILNQTYKDYEVIIIDDGSTDDTEAVVSRFLDKRIVYIRQSNAGAGAARNNGIRSAKGQYIAFLDSDDEWTPEHLFTHYEYLSKLCFPILVTRSYVKTKKRTGDLEQQLIVSHLGLSPQEYMLRSAVSPITSIAHASIFQEFKFNEKIPISIDAECWFRIFSKYSIHSLPKHTAVVYEHDSNLTSPSILTYEKYIQVWRDFIKYNSNYIISDHIGDLLKSYISNNYFYKMYLLTEERQKISALNALRKSVIWDRKKALEKETLKMLLKILFK